MGAAEYHAPIAPMMKGIDVTSMTKDSMGWGAMVGVASVLMARKGFTGIRPIFGDAKDSTIVTSLGTHWDIMGICFKVRLILSNVAWFVCVTPTCVTPPKLAENVKYPHV